MTGSQAENVVLATGIVTAVVIVHDTLRKTSKATPPVKTIVSGLLIFGALSLGAQAAPNVFGPAALLVGLAVVYSKIGPATKGAK